MSVEAMAWAFKQEIDDAQTKLVLLALCDHADEDGLCWPSQERLAKKAACSHDTAARRLLALEKLGFIQRRRRARQNTIYRILLDKKLMRTQTVRDHHVAPTARERDEILNTQNPLMITQNALDDNATGASLTINTKPSIETTTGSLFASDDAKPTKRKKRQPMPEDWQPDERGVLFAKNLGFTEIKISQLVMACRDYHLKHGTLIAGSIGLSATWRTWCNNEAKFSAEREARYGANTGGHRPTRSETIIAGSRDYANEMARRRGGQEISEYGARAVDGHGTSADHSADRRH